jgi:hypothetical protein
MEIAMLPEQNAKKINELVPPMSVTNPKAYKTMLDRQIAKGVKVKTALNNKEHPQHEKAKSWVQKIKDKFKSKKKDEPKPEKQSKADADFYKRQFESMNEAKIQVPGIGMYDEKTLKSKIVKLATNLQKLAKKGDFSKASENGIRALGRMWGAYQDWQRKNESVNEGGTINVEPNWEGMWRFFKQMAKTNPRDWKRMERTLGSDWKKIDAMAEKNKWTESVNEGQKRDYETAYTTFYNAYKDFANASMDIAKESTKISGDKTDQKIILKNFKKQVIPFIGLMSSWNKGHQKNPHLDESDLGLTYKKGKTVKVKHKTSGKSLVIIDKPNVRKEYEKIGFYAESVNEEKVKKLSVYMPKKTAKKLPQIKKFVQRFVPNAKFDMKGNVLYIDGGGKSMKRLSQLIYNEFYVDKVNWNESVNINERMDRRQGAETLKQLGGNRFIAMTGAKDFGVGPKGMSFKIGRNSKRVNYIRIDLKNDLYNMEFMWVSKKGIKVIKKVKGVYNDQLQKMFTKYTGMYTSL